MGASQSVTSWELASDAQRGQVLELSKNQSTFLTLNPRTASLGVVASFKLDDNTLLPLFSELRKADKNVQRMADRLLPLNTKEGSISEQEFWRNYLSHVIEVIPSGASARSSSSSSTDGPTSSPPVSKTNSKPAPPAGPPLLFVSLDGTEVALERELLPPNVTCTCLAAKCLDDISDESIEQADFVAVWHTLRIDGELAGRLKKAKIIVRMGVGYDNVDCKATGALGLPVVNVPNYGTEEVRGERGEGTGHA
jgi:hypothetical protein